VEALGRTHGYTKGNQNTIQVVDLAPLNDKVRPEVLKYATAIVYSDTHSAQMKMISQVQCSCVHNITATNPIDSSSLAALLESRPQSRGSNLSGLLKYLGSFPKAKALVSLSNDEDLTRLYRAEEHFVDALGITDHADGRMPMETLFYRDNDGSIHQRFQLAMCHGNPLSLQCTLKANYHGIILPIEAVVSLKPLRRLTYGVNIGKSPKLAVLTIISVTSARQRSNVTEDISDISEGCNDVASLFL
jgi:hypothetical protein